MSFLIYLYARNTNEPLKHKDNFCEDISIVVGTNISKKILMQLNEKSDFGLYSSLSFINYAMDTVGLSNVISIFSFNLFNMFFI